jgi:predicted GNAT family acetyltransferase
MKSKDLQIGDTWTMPEHRGKGLATFALRKVIEIYAESGRAMWYVVAEDNLPSIRVVEKTGFNLVGSGTKQKRLGLSLLGSYVIESDANLE